MLVQFYLPRLSNDMKIAVQKHHLCGINYALIFFVHKFSFIFIIYDNFYKVMLKNWIEVIDWKKSVDCNNFRTPYRRNRITRTNGQKNSVKVFSVGGQNGSQKVDRDQFLRQIRDGVRLKKRHDLRYLDNFP